MPQSRLFRIFMSAVVGVLLHVPAQAQTRSYITSGQDLQVGSTLVSDDGNFYLQVRNLNTKKGWYTAGFAVYKGTPAKEFGLVKTHDKMGGRVFNDFSNSTDNFILALQPDANLCLYRGSVSDAGRTWCSMATAPNPPFFVALQGDGNLCVYRGSGPGDNKGGIWCSYTNTPVTWISSSARFTFPTNGAYGVPATGALAGNDGGTVTTSLNATDTRAFWAFDNGMLRWAPNRDRCMVAGAGDPRVLTVGACTQGGWQVSGDGTLRNSNVPNACVEFVDSGMWRDCCPEAVTHTAVLKACGDRSVKFTVKQ